MNVANVQPASARTPYRLVNRPEGRAPADDDHPAIVGAKADFLVGDRVRDARHLGGAQPGHFGVSFRRIVDVSGARILFDAADAMLQPGGTWLDPRPRQIVVPSIWHDLVVVWLQ